MILFVQYHLLFINLTIFVYPGNFWCKKVTSAQVDSLDTKFN